MQTQLSSSDRTSTTRECEYTAQRSVKRLKTDSGSCFKELEATKRSRVNTFSHSPFPEVFRLRLIEAGFFYCNKNDRVICIYCYRICEQWNANEDDPCEVHKVLSPNCCFVKSMTCYHSSQYKKITRTLPRHKGYVYLKNRLQSFSTWSGCGFPPKEKLADAGFFFDGSKIACFYCNYTFDSWESDNHPLAEHVRYSPHCNYARQLCGERLYHTIQQSWKITNRIGNSTNIYQPLSAMDPNKFDNNVNAHLDLPMSVTVLKKFSREIVKQCWINELRFEDGEFNNSADLDMACRILLLQNEHLGNGQRNIVVPGIELSRIYGSGRQPLLNSSNQSYADVVASFESDYQAYKEEREALSVQFKEDEEVTIEREKSMFNRTNIILSPRALADGGWIICADDDNVSQCPHCFMQYSQWESDDNPLLIHQQLSPLCLFALSSSPLHENPATLKKTGEQYSIEVINGAASQSYDGVVRVKNETYSEIRNRQRSFDSFPHNHQINTDELAINGFSYNDRHRCMQCFYCKRTMLISERTPRINCYSKQLHLVCRCPYAQQFHDQDPVRSIQQVSSNLKCEWCLTEDKCAFAVSCRHSCLCEPCSKIKRLCPRCNKSVTAYVKMYRS